MCYGRDSLNPPYEGGCKADRGQVVSCQSVVARCDAPEVLQPTEGTLDAPAKLVETFVEGEWLFSIAAIGNDRLSSALVQVFAQLGTIVSFIAEHVFRWSHSANETLRDRTVVCVTSGQQAGEN